MHVWDLPTNREDDYMASEILYTLYCNHTEYEIDRADVMRTTIVNKRHKEIFLISSVYTDITE